jgi:beta-aspartyl-peptidase (threonine type)
MTGVRPGVIVHGGAGAGGMAPERLAPYRAGLAAAVEAGWRALEQGGGALDAVEAAIRSMEVCGHFNAGKGSCLNLEKEVECDAAVMLGADLRAGAVGALKGYAHPVSLARKILEETDHVLIVGAGAERLAEAFGIERWPEGPTPERLREWAEIEERVRTLPRGPRVGRLAALLRHGAEESGRAAAPLPIDKADTVGAVAIDAQGRLAAGVSTGGLWLKLPGRVGDSAIPGAGIYADDRLGAVSATGIGEAIIRIALSRRAVEAMGAVPNPGQAGVEHAIRLMTDRMGEHTAGLVGLDREGRPGAAFNTEAMGRAYLGRGLGSPAVAVARNDPFPI